MIYEGIVTSLKENGKADVTILPPGAGVPGVSREINAKVCHCTSQGSNITVEALNSAGADVGDRVFLTRDTSTIVKNYGILLGTPLGGVGGGMAIAFLIADRFPSAAPVAVATGILFALIAFALSIAWYRKSSAGSDPVIEGILQAGKNDGAEMCGSVFPLVRNGHACRDCSGDASR